MLWVPQALEKNIDLGFEGIPAQVVPVRGDAHRLPEMIGNLLDNAIRYTQPGGHGHRQRAVTKQGGAVLRVEDNGPGIAPPNIASGCSSAFTACSAAVRAAAGLASPSWRRWRSATAPRSVWTRGETGKGHWLPFAFRTTELKSRRSIFPSRLAACAPGGRLPSGCAGRGR